MRYLAGSTRARTVGPPHPALCPGIHENGVVVGNPLKLALNVHPQTGIDHCDSRYAAFAARLLWDTSHNATIPCDFGNATFVDALYAVYWDAQPLHNNDIWWTDYGGCGVSAGNPLLWNNRVVYDHMKYGREIRGEAFSRYGGLGVSAWECFREGFWCLWVLGLEASVFPNRFARTLAPPRLPMAEPPLPPRLLR